MKLIEVKHPEGLPHAIGQMTGAFRLIEMNQLPQKLVGWFMVTSCLHILRCVFGTDRDSLAAVDELRKYVAEGNRELADFNAKLQRHDDN